jgi:hypothetical protein
MNNGRLVEHVERMMQSQLVPGSAVEVRDLQVSTTPVFGLVVSVPGDCMAPVVVFISKTMKWRRIKRDRLAIL